MLDDRSSHLTPMCMDGIVTQGCSSLPVKIHLKLRDSIVRWRRLSEHNENHSTIGKWLCHNPYMITSNTTPDGPGQDAADSSVRTSGNRRARGEAFDLACAKLLQLALELGPGARLPGLRFLRDSFGVSQGTLNDALTHLEQQHVLVRYERKGVFVATGIGQHNICLICVPDFLLQSSVTPFWEEMINGARELASRHNTNLTIGFSHPLKAESNPSDRDDPTPLPDYLQNEILSGSVHGVISIGLPYSTVRWIENQHVPVVSFAGASRFIITSSWVKMVKVGITTLAAEGMKHVEVWVPKTESWLDNELQLTRLVKQLKGRLCIHSEIIMASSDVSSFRGQALNPKVESGWECALKRLRGRYSRADQPDGLLLLDDQLALGALMGMYHLGLEPGKDLQIASMTNAGSPLLLGWHDRIYRLEYDLGELVSRLFETLIALIEYGPDAVQDKYVPPFNYNLPEYPNPRKIPEKYRLIYPRLVPPARIQLDTANT